MTPISPELEQAVAALKAGQKTTAQNILMRVLRQDPKNTLAWRLMAETQDDPARRAECLKRAGAGGVERGAPSVERKVEGQDVERGAGSGERKEGTQGGAGAPAAGGLQSRIAAASGERQAESGTAGGVAETGAAPRMDAPVTAAPRMASAPGEPHPLAPSPSERRGGMTGQVSAGAPVEGGQQSRIGAASGERQEAPRPQAAAPAERSGGTARPAGRAAAGGTAVLALREKPAPLKWVGSALSAGGLGALLVLLVGLVLRGLLRIELNQMLIMASVPALFGLLSGALARMWAHDKGRVKNNDLVNLGGVPGTLCGLATMLAFLLIEQFFWAPTETAGPSPFALLSSWLTGGVLFTVGPGLLAGVAGAFLMHWVMPQEPVERGAGSVERGATGQGAGSGERQDEGEQPPDWVRERLGLGPAADEPELPAAAAWPEAPITTTPITAGPLSGPAQPAAPLPATPLAEAPFGEAPVMAAPEPPSLPTQFSGWPDEEPKVPKLDPYSPLKQAIALINDRRYDEARAVLEKLVADDPSNVGGWLRLATLTADRERKRYYVEQALAANPGSQMAQQMLAEIDPQALANFKAPPRPAQARASAAASTPPGAAVNAAPSGGGRPGFSLPPLATTAFGRKFANRVGIFLLLGGLCGLCMPLCGLQSETLNSLSNSSGATVQCLAVLALLIGGGLLAWLWLPAMLKKK